MDNDPQVHNITDALPTMEPKTRTNVKKLATIGTLALGGLLLLDDQVKRFRNRKNVTVTVTDTDAPES